MTFARSYAALVSILLGVLLTLGACGSTDDTSAATTGSDTSGAQVADAGANSDGTATTDVGATDAGPPDAGSAKATPATPIAYSAGSACPTLNKGANAFWSWGKTRQVDLYLPTNTKDAGLLFLWHGLGGSKENFGAGMNAQGLANALQAVVVVPQGGLKFTGWGWGTMEDSTEDAALFDDLLTCVDTQFDIDNKRVWSMGFSAGALWTSWLILHRSTFIASAVAWSGGTGANSNLYKKPKRKIPALLAWGGPKDQAMMQFETTTLTMAKHLRADGHFVATCNHGLGHTIPSSGLTWAIDFLKRHPWGVETSDLATDAAVQKLYPTYCSFQ